MHKNIHGHDVLAMMLRSNRGYTREQLRQAIDSVFGTSSRFDACVAQGMTAEELIDFLVARNKFRTEADGWHVNEGEICDG